MAASDSAARFALIQENLAEVLNDEIIKKILDEGQHPKIYWGAWTGNHRKHTEWSLLRADCTD